jgi:hypothetical protein
MQHVVDAATAAVQHVTGRVPESRSSSAPVSAHSPTS